MKTNILKLSVLIFFVGTANAADVIDNSSDSDYLDSTAPSITSDDDFGPVQAETLQNGLSSSFGDGSINSFEPDSLSSPVQYDSPSLDKLSNDLNVNNQ